MDMKKSALLFSLLSAFFAAAADARIRNQGAGSGGITLEVDNPEKIYQKAAELVQKHGATLSSYNCNGDIESGQSYVSAQITVDKAKVSLLMGEVASLGKVQSQNYYEAIPADSDSESLDQQIEALDKEVAVLGPFVAKIPMVLGLAAQHRQGLTGQQQHAASVDPDKATLNLSLQQTGYAGRAGGKSSKGLPLPWVAALLSITALLASWAGFAAGKLRIGG